MEQKEQLSPSRQAAKLIAIEGVSLAGKTTLCKRLSYHPQIRHLPELSTFHKNGRNFPKPSNSDFEAGLSDMWFLQAELARHFLLKHQPTDGAFTLIDRTFVSMIVFGIARKVLYDVGEPWKTAKRIFQSELAMNGNCPFHFYLQIDLTEYHCRKSAVIREIDEPDAPIGRIRFEEQVSSLIETQIEIYNQLFGTDSERIITGKEQSHELLRRATETANGREKTEIEILRSQVDNVLSKLGLPSTQH